ncbi:hypothetical protein CEP93_025255 [Salmonella enterica subsp. enterica serovar Infantis]|nr:hypothetical protein CEP93_025255 [Salmonella enterica subsp. enterica serovar Infantis]
MTFNLPMAQDITGYGPLFPIKPPRRRVILFIYAGRQRSDGQAAGGAAQQLADRSPPVIVAIGYQTNLPFDLNGRAYDYTPAPGIDREGSENNPRFHRKTGGGPAFRQLLERHIAPQVEQGITINPERRGYGDILMAVRFRLLAVVIPFISITAPARHSAGITLSC